MTIEIADDGSITLDGKKIEEGNPLYSYFKGVAEKVKAPNAPADDRDLIDRGLDAVKDASLRSSSAITEAIHGQPNAPGTTTAASRDIDRLKAAKAAAGQKARSLAEMTRDAVSSYTDPPPKVAPGTGPDGKPITEEETSP